MAGISSDEFEKLMYAPSTSGTSPSVSTQTEGAFKLDTKEKSLSQFARDKVFMSKLKTYATDRFGDDGISQQDKDESNEDYVERFLTHIRRFDNTVDLAAQVDWQRNATMEQRENFGSVYKEIDDKLPTIWEKGGGGVGKGLLDYFEAWVGDPINLVSLGVGKIIGRAGIEAVKKSFIEGGKEAAKQTAKKFSIREARGAGVTEAVTEAGQDVLQQEVEQAATPDEEQETSLLRTAIAGGIGGGLGYGLTRLGSRSNFKSNVKQLEKEAPIEKKS